MPYQSIVFLQGDDANEPLDALYARQGDSICYSGPFAETVDAAFEYLRAWDYGEPTEETDEPSCGTSDDTWEQDGYRLSAHLGLGYIGLERIVTLPVESYRCPCCGTDVMDTRPVCGDCRTAKCEQTVDAVGDLGWSNCDRTDTDDYAVDGAA
jgi:hypothetical protein